MTTGLWILIGWGMGGFGFALGWYVGYRLAARDFRRGRARG
jgi:hypothetical protein